MSQSLVNAEELRGLVADPEVVLLDVRFWLGQPGRGREAFEAGHLPGAQFVDVDADLSAPLVSSADARPGTHPGGRHPRPGADQLTDLCRRLGISADSTVVAYDQGGNLSAARAWWVLTDAGVAGVRVLDGGVTAWVEAGGELTTESSASRAPGTFTAQPGQLPTVDATELVAAQAAGSQVVDVRAPERFRGESESVDPVAGHVPGAKNLPASLYASASGYRGEDRLHEVFAELCPGDVLMCGSGITAAQALLAAESAGVQGLRIYPGSWSDWISDPVRPVATGD